MPEFEASTRCSPPRFRDLCSSRSTMKRSHCATASFRPIFNHFFSFFLKTINHFEYGSSRLQKDAAYLNKSNASGSSKVVFQAIFENIRKIKICGENIRATIGEKFSSNTVYSHNILLSSINGNFNFEKDGFYLIII